MTDPKELYRSTLTQDVYSQSGGGAGASDSMIRQQTLNQVNRGGRPWIEIVEQPRSRGLRFRYKCEGRSAGTIPGETSTTENRVYPTIRINNYSGPTAIVVVSCVTKDDPPRPHPHSLVGKDCKQGVCTVKLKGTTTVSFPSLGIQCATKKEIQDALKQREKIRVDPWGTSYFTNINNIELSTVRLAFQAFLPDDNGKYTRIVPPTVSQCIFDKKAVTDLVICRLSKQSGSVAGKEEIFLLCEKVTKDDIQIRFFEESKEDGLVSWEKYGEFGQQDVHRQVAIVFKTPEYRDQNITQPVTVKMQLRRPSDDEVSEPKPFQYIPNDPDPDFVGRKRKRKQLNYDNFLKDVTIPENYQSQPPVNVKDAIKEKLMKKANKGHILAQGAESQQVMGTDQFMVPQHAVEKSGDDVVYATSYSPSALHQQVFYHQTTDGIIMPKQEIEIAADQEISTAEILADPNQQRLTAVSMSTDSSAKNDVYAMIAANTGEMGGDGFKISSLPSLPSALLQPNYTTDHSVSHNLAVLQGDAGFVAAEETVESMNEDTH